MHIIVFLLLLYYPSCILISTLLQHKRLRAVPFIPPLHLFNESRENLEREIKLTREFSMAALVPLEQFWLVRLHSGVQYQQVFLLRWPPTSCQFICL